MIQPVPSASQLPRAERKDVINPSCSSGVGGDDPDPDPGWGGEGDPDRGGGCSPNQQQGHTPRAVGQEQSRGHAGAGGG